MPSLKMKTAFNFFVENRFNGCITGACLICPDEDENVWNTDIDFFAYSYEDWLKVVHFLLGSGFKPATPADKEKLKFKKAKGIVTVNLIHEELRYNITFKESRTVFDVLSSFDIKQVQNAICCKTGQFVSLGNSTSNQVYFDYSEEALSLLEVDKVLTLSPFRRFTSWGLQTWQRELNRILKYKGRGFDVSMLCLQFLEIIADEVAKPDVFGTIASETRRLKFLADTVQTTKFMEELAEVPASTSIKMEEELKESLANLTEEQQKEFLETIRFEIDRKENK